MGTTVFSTQMLEFKSGLRTLTRSSPLATIRDFSAST